MISATIEEAVPKSSEYPSRSFAQPAPAPNNKCVISEIAGAMLLVLTTL